MARWLNSVSLFAGRLAGWLPLFIQVNGIRVRGDEIIALLVLLNTFQFNYIKKAIHTSQFVYLAYRYLDISIYMIFTHLYTCFVASSPPLHSSTIISLHFRINQTREKNIYNSTYHSPAILCLFFFLFLFRSLPFKLLYTLSIRIYLCLYEHIDRSIRLKKFIAGFWWLLLLFYAHHLVSIDRINK